MKRVVLSGVCSKMSAESANVWGHLLGASSGGMVNTQSCIYWHDTTHYDSEGDYHTGCKTSVTVNNSPIQDYVHPDDHAPPTYEMIPGFKPFTIISLLQFNSDTAFVCLFVCLFVHWASFHLNVKAEHFSSETIFLWHSFRWRPRTT